MSGVGEEGDERGRAGSAARWAGAFHRPGHCLPLRAPSLPWLSCCASLLERAGAILLCLTWCHVLDVCNGRPLVPSLGLPVMHLLSEVVEESWQVGGRARDGSHALAVVAGSR